MKEYLISRLKEASTWRGLILIATSLGLSIDPVMADSVIAVGIAAAGAVGAFFPDAK